MGKFATVGDKFLESDFKLPSRSSGKYFSKLPGSSLVDCENVFSLPSPQISTGLLNSVVVSPSTTGRLSLSSKEGVSTLLRLFI